MKRIFFFAWALALVWLTAVPEASPGALFRAADGERISFSDAVKDLKRASVVLVGEFHDSKDHHALQLKVIEALKRTGRPVAVGLEMFQQAYQEQLDQWSAAELNEEDFERIYYENWGLPWSLYRDIFLFARDHAIPLLGLNVPPQITRKVAREGFQALTAEERGRLPMVTCRVDKAYMDFIRRSFGAHHRGHRGDFEHFCEAQLVWDTVMAFNVVQFLKRHPDHVVVVLAGSGHAWRPGIPRQLSAQSEGIVTRIILPEIPGRLDPQNVSPEDTDYLWLVD